ncbi:hypothetical protein TGPRC2_210220 [Toxoplasma gondii TgCatPRC2]|uniref:Uncharacterized protein n=11 Tax=Toxoplasma gondii TaxID=5811 RepID=A0A125YSY3_TOXGV|nr:hypothetical protein TGME49_210220 [Toxoplasma gondii ME49]EPR59645.1 hypothetical protein TGGT1_210220 [Toxoplasma gondii GT1]ESS28365.1 hypothetical protein TGVEG_210220 [Toxoplasma gondii VEG]KFG28043.1 hypothetical protein TGP89_210220 [Toxoplasma gondii p89]KFG29625.1 hypothetical protein TGDOM2_210220 [Toxoplasma gondii GAB2-2007-GAL-DOM2]KFG33348.1 hypothetical protein TGFOU_210220 [Toxoplasma gondii FOU]KFG62970.1 hypothetical protein TGRUB_210220 [Toxoplasma gondii RUB]KFH12771.1|eukprot:XP_018636515.1 hypothetical protein TGME49_210220 [Toxoplasma gondii ME49]
MLHSISADDRFYRIKPRGSGEIEIVHSFSEHAYVRLVAISQAEGKRTGNKATREATSRGCVCHIGCNRQRTGLAFLRLCWSFR